MPSFITLDSVSAATPERQTLFSNLTLSVGTERLGFVGRNGSGKSTLLHIIAGDADPAAGTVVRSGSVGVLGRNGTRVSHDPTFLEAIGIERTFSVG